MLTRKTVILAKIEATYGTDPVPTVTANALAVSDVDLKPSGETIRRDYVKSSLSRLPFARGIKSYELSFKTELKGTGTRGVLPAFGWEGPLFRACGMQEAVTASTSIVYTPVSTAFESVALYVYLDGVFHKLLGCKGSFKLNLEVGKYPIVEWKFNGIYAAPTDATPAAQTLSSIQPVTVLGASFTIGSYAAVIEKLELDINNTISARKSINAATGIVGYEITGRAPQGSFDPEATLEATHTFWANWAGATQLALAIGPIGTTSGNILAIAAPKVQYREISHGDRDGTLTYQVPIDLAMNAGDDELTITLT